MWNNLQVSHKNAGRIDKTLIQIFDVLNFKVKSEFKETGLNICLRFSYYKEINFFVAAEGWKPSINELLKDNVEGKILKNHWFN